MPTRLIEPGEFSLLHDRFEIVDVDEETLSGMQGIRDMNSCSQNNSIIAEEVDNA